MLQQLGIMETGNSDKAATKLSELSVSITLSTQSMQTNFHISQHYYQTTTLIKLPPLTSQHKTKMQEYYFLFALAFVWTTFATIQDPKNRQVAN